MRIYDREGQEVLIDQRQNHLLKRLYGSILGRCLLKVLTLPFVTFIGGKYMNSRFSKHRIQPFIQSNHIDMQQYIQQDFKSYNDFFIRQIKPEYRPIDDQPHHLIAPADSKLTYYPIEDNLLVEIKDTVYSLADLLDDPKLARSFAGGTCLIFRLSVDDYHHYCFIDDGTKEMDHYIPGKFHTVNPIANDYYPIYKQNSRSYSVLHTQHFGDVVYMEVGAMMVGKIVNRPVTSFKRGDEKGYFEFGGSTIVLLLRKDCVIIDEDIIDHSTVYDETRVLMGEKIGVKNETLC